MAPPTPVALDTDVTWIHGAPSPRRRHDPPLQVHRLAPGTVLIRQSKDLTYEAPFILLLLGERRALLLDSGAVDGATLRQTVDRLISDHLAAQTPAAHTPATQTPRDAQTPPHAYDPAVYELVVAHTHGHGDHVAGDAAFADRPRTTVVGHGVASVCAFFGISEWPTEVVTLDLGGRPLEVFGIPGHHAASIAIHDRTTGLLHTGDTVYPGRIYVNDPNALLDTLDRLVTFADERTVSHVLGCHVEMTRRPGRDYPLGSRYQPDEPSPFMTVAQLHGVRDAFRAVAHRPGIHRFDDVVFCVGEGPRVLVPLQLRALVEQVRWRLGMLRRRPAP
ncbi:MBL fold metallo-hydrolase [Terrabacter sp. Ter38]|uniref:MBL fold metallo-hydrolase n=1 Tax=Terrabacter sp. Ter38 TaxID=2926030 RepID=UPI002118E800|nr:MBL fold metallo-hydrolase [Terrabacter sp. Ter38]